MLRLGFKGYDLAFTMRISPSCWTVCQCACVMTPSRQQCHLLVRDNTSSNRRLHSVPSRISGRGKPQSHSTSHMLHRCLCL